MDYEKKYKDVQKWVESIYTKLDHQHQMKVEALFPALRESKGERIRETLIDYIKNWQKGYSIWNSDKDFCNDAIAWLKREKPVTFSFEEGEKIRESLLRLVHDTTRDELLDNYEVHKEKALEWLEKQGNSIEEIKGNN